MHMQPRPDNTQRDAEIVKRRCAGESNHHIARLYGITPERVSQIYRAWLAKQPTAEPSPPVAT